MSRLEREGLPRMGPNNKISEIDLRLWETIFIQGLKLNNKFDQYYDISKALECNIDIRNLEMKIEYAWSMRSWDQLKELESIMKRSDSLKHRLYLLFLQIKDGNISQFDEVFKNAVSFSSNRWDVQLPKYVDTIHFDNLILYQLIMEGSEGGRNMIKEAQINKNKGKLVDMKTACNIWRERAPSMHEPLHGVWNEVLENRNFIFD
jgi:hypothetical protein